MLEGRFSLFLLGPFTSVSQTKSSSSGLIKSLEETKDHRRGRKPPVTMPQERKPRGGDRVLNLLFPNLLESLSPRRGFFSLRCSFPGACAPVCGLSRLQRLHSGQQYPGMMLGRAGGIGHSTAVGSISRRGIMTKSRSCMWGCGRVSRGVESWRSSYMSRSMSMGRS